MNCTFKAAVAALMLAVGFAGSVAAEPFFDALAASARGDHATALRLLRPLAEQGEAHAQGLLGAMYEKGDGASQDYVIAHMWFNLAVANGDKDAVARDWAVQGRDRIAAQMTPAQIAEAQKLAREWKPK